MTRFLENRATDCWLVAFDIVGFSDFLDHPGALLEHRNNLIEAVEQTAFFKHHLEKGPGRAQFLGDELRLAIPATAVEAHLVTAATFAEEVIAKLELMAGTTPGTRTAVRAAVVRGVLRAESRNGWSRLVGPAVDALDALQDLEGGDGRVTSQRSVDGYDLVGGAWRSGLRGAELSLGGRGTPTPHGIPTTFFALQPASRSGQDPVGAMLAVLRNLWSTWPKTLPVVVQSISPRGAVIGVPGDDFVGAKWWLDRLRPQLTDQHLGLGVARGDRVDIERWPWIPDNFESAAAVMACRIAAKIGPGRVGVHASVWPLAGTTFDRWPVEDVPGKRDEVFQCRVDPAAPPEDAAESSSRSEPDAQRQALEELIADLSKTLATANGLLDAWARRANTADSDVQPLTPRALVEEISKRSVVEVIAIARDVAGDARDLREADPVAAQAIARALAATLPTMLACANPTDAMKAGKMTSFGAATVRVSTSAAVPIPPRPMHRTDIDFIGETVLRTREVLGLDPTGRRAAAAAQNELMERVLPLLRPRDIDEPDELARINGMLERLRKARRASDRVVFAVVIGPRDDSAEVDRVWTHLRGLRAVPVIELQSDATLAGDEADSLIQPYIETYHDLTEAMRP